MHRHAGHASPTLTPALSHEEREPALTHLLPPSPWGGLRGGAEREPFDEEHNVHPAARADEAINAGHCFYQFVGTALRIAPGGDEMLSRLFGLRQFS